MRLQEKVQESEGRMTSFQEEHVDSCEEYLEQGGWEDAENPLHEQEWVRNEMGSFHSSQEQQLQHRQCTVCKETWPTKQNLSKDPARYICHRCTRDKKSPKMYSLPQMFLKSSNLQMYNLPQMRNLAIPQVMSNQKIMCLFLLPKRGTKLQITNRKRTCNFLPYPFLLPKGGGKTK